MAKIEEATVYIHEVAEKGRLRLSERHSKKDANDEWQVTGYTDITGWLPRDYAGPELAKGDRIKVSATQRTEERESNGTKYKNLIWGILTVEKVAATGGQRQEPSQESPF